MGSLLTHARTAICSLAFLLYPTSIVASPKLYKDTNSSSNSIYDVTCFSQRHHLTVEHCQYALSDFHSQIPSDERPTFTNDHDKAMTLPHHLLTLLHFTSEECTFSVHLPHSNDVTVDAMALYEEGSHLLSRCVGWWGISGGYVAVRAWQANAYVWIYFMAHHGSRQGPGS
jgi:hypothetical protein